MTQSAQSLSWYGEFNDPALEAEFKNGRLRELLRLARTVFWCAAGINLLFLFSDWRFYGQPHFPVAIGARGVIVGVSLLGWLLLPRNSSLRRVQNVCAAWCAPVIAAAAALLLPQTESARLILVILPMAFYLTLPMPTRWVMAAGVAVSAATLAAHLSGAENPALSLGIGLSVLTLNVVLAIVLVRINRLQRLEWAANRDLTENQAMLQSLLRAVPAPLVILACDASRVIHANDAAHEFFGESILADPAELLERLVGECPPNQGQIDQCETRFDLGDGGIRSVIVVSTLAALRGEHVLLAILIDITLRKEMEAHLKLLASTDPLTGLLNRGRFFELAGEEVSRSRRYERPLAVVMLDIDLFKNINDTYGHTAGDAALKSFADLCRSLIRAPDIIGRIGGEEFALLLPETNGVSARALADRLRAAVAAMRIDGLPAVMTVSAGISELAPDETAIDAALSRADGALYEAKRGGRNRVVLRG